LKTAGAGSRRQVVEAKEIRLPDVTFVIFAVSAGSLRIAVMTHALRRIAVQGALLLAAFAVFAPIYHIKAQESTAGARRILTKVAPQYPVVAHRMAIQGVVKVEATVSPNGSVKAVEVKGGHPMLAQAAQDAVRGWKWEPSPKETRELVSIRFNW
jgi:TonB family protein